MPNFFQIMVITISLSSVLSVFANDDPTLNKVDTEIYQTSITNSAWEEKVIDPMFYDNPYQVSLFSPNNAEDSDRLVSQTYSIFGYGMGVLAVLALMPEEITNWSQDDIELGKKWIENVQAGPVWDRDDVVLNYIMHPYFGGVYYQSARKSGYRQWDAFLYSATMSTFFWEYGIEAFAEIPSIQDLVVTPVMGWAYGEWAYTTEQSIWHNGGTLLDSEYLGNTALFLLDPVDSIGRNFNRMWGKDVIKAGTGYFTFEEVPLPHGNGTENQFALNVNFIIGTDDTPALAGISGKRSRQSHPKKNNDDPVDTGIIGLSMGGAWINVDNEWEKQSSYGYQWSLGLYFTRSFSTRLNYTRATIDNKFNSGSDTYENYGLDSQYYFNTDNDWRPFVTAGLGEMMWDEDRSTKRFQINAGLGLHYKINNNWAIQTDWRNYYSTRTERHEEHLSSSILYRFGKGEWSL